MLGRRHRHGPSFCAAPDGGSPIRPRHGRCLPDPSSFTTLVASLARAVADGSVSPEAARHELSLAAAIAVIFSSAPQECLTKLNALSIAGLDWRTIFDPASGKSLLGLIFPTNGSGKQEVGIALLAQGADPMGAFSIPTHDKQEISCIETIMSDPLIWIITPSLSLAALIALDDESFTQIFADAGQADRLRNMCLQLSSLVWPLAVVGASISAGDTERVVARLSKITADKEAAAIAECIPGARRSMSPKGL